jgi:hypothetical protein
MTEAEWGACTNPQRMLEYVPFKVSKRKWALIAVAVCRRIRHLLPDNESWQAAEAAESWSDGLLSLRDLNLMKKKSLPQLGETPERSTLAYCAAHAAASPGKQNTCRAAALSRHAIVDTGGTAEIEETHQCHLIRDILGYPYAAMGNISRWRSGNVVSLAEAIYTERAFDRLPILADALEDAGCDHADILEHCRGPGPHVRGCWVVDLILGKS